jgi:hypothetical protein
MIEISRRTLFGAMGAGLVLASCRNPDEPERPGEKVAGNATEGKDCPGILGKGVGESALWGDSVNRPRPRFVPAAAQFKPGYVCAAYTRFEPDGIIVRQGHAQLTGTAIDSETEQNQIAVKLLKELRSPSTSPLVNVEFPSQNFENFSMNGQQVLVLFIDNPPSLVRFVSAADMPPATGGKPQENFLEHIVRFTQFSGQNIGEEMQKNHAFAALKPLDVSGQGLDGLLAYRLNFWNTIAGKNIEAKKSDPTTHARYSMNIYLRMTAKPAGSGGSTVGFPLVLDPDTGNMGANP